MLAHSNQVRVVPQVRAPCSLPSVAGRVLRALLAGLCATLLGLCAILLSSCEQHGPPLRVAFTTTEGNESRTFVDPPDSLVTLLGRPPHDLGNPAAAALTDRGDIYVADFGNLVVRHFDPSGGFVRDYGAGQGEGPGEFQALVDVEVDEGGRVAGLDPLLSRVVVFDATGGLVGSGGHRNRCVRESLRLHGRYVGERVGTPTCRFVTGAVSTQGGA